MLGYTTIVAPIDGRTGIRQVDEGNIVHASDATGIVTITAAQPISVMFNLPQQELNAGQRRFRQGPAAGRGAALRQRCGDRPRHAQVVDNQVDQSTGTVKLKAEFPNADLQLWPGQFVNVRLLIDTLQRRGGDPDRRRAARAGTGTFVYVVKDDNTVDDAADHRAASRTRRRPWSRAA